VVFTRDRSVLSAFILDTFSDVTNLWNRWFLLVMLQKLLVICSDPCSYRRVSGNNSLDVCLNHGC
jgi:hypothetical protein